MELQDKSAEQKRMLGHPNIRTIASRHDATPAQVALAWLLRQPDIVAIPKASRPEHVRENRAALEIELTDGDIRELDKALPLLDRKIPLEVL
jgi:diketogulonate reductase-like aldo/keto reductase